MRVRAAGPADAEAVARGTYRRHAKLDGGWRDVVVVERLLGEARAQSRGR